MNLPRQTAATLYFKDMAEREQMAEIRRLFRKVFATPDGAIVLSAILQDLGWNKETTTTEAGALKNYASHLLQERLGITNDVLAVVTAVMNDEIKETP
jgi:hypothetical protein